MQEHIGTQMQKVQTVQPGESPALDPLDDKFIRPGFKDAPRFLAKEYSELKHLIKQKGLLDKQPIYYVYKIALTMGLLAVGLIFLVIGNNFWLQLLNAAYLGFVFTQIGFLAHDIGHRQVFRTTGKSDTFGLVAGTLLLGWSWSWWLDRHNRHHGHPNELDIDPDLAMPLLAFTEENARSKRNFLRFMVKYQAYFFFPLLLLVAFSALIWSIQFLFQKKAKYPRAEMLLMTLHYLLCFGLLLSQLNIWQAVLFITVQQAFFGLYMGSVFAPNHKGMPVLDKDSSMDFLRRQVLTSRNIKAHPVTDFWYGGLNYQIEHHLFPSIPRNKLKEAQQIVRAFCKEHAIAYHETSVFRSYKEIVQYMHEVSAPLRGEKA